MIKIEVSKKRLKLNKLEERQVSQMKKINPLILVVIVLIAGFCAFKVMSFLGCYVRIEDANECWKLTAW